jgi:type II secretory pathway component PulK
MVKRVTQSRCLFLNVDAIRRSRGSILIFTLWILSTLVIFSAVIGMSIRQRIQLFSSIESRQQLRDLAGSAVKKAIVMVEHDVQRQRGFFTADHKMYRHRNPDLLSWQALGRGSFQVAYAEDERFRNQVSLVPGVLDEESRLNVNVASREELRRLISLVTSAADDDVAIIVDGILGWRSYGDASQEGFYSQNYYANLAEPYSPKGADFEILEELLLVQGVTPQIFHELRPYITVYGDGLVNINTASAVILETLGLEPPLVDKILEVRRGEDAIEATRDDHIFLRAYDIAAEVQQRVSLTAEEIQRIDELNTLQKIKIESAYFRIQAQARLADRPGEMEVTAVYNAIDRWIEYYHEK